MPPKTSNPKLPFPMRLPADLLYKLEQVAKADRRPAKDLVKLLVEDAVAEYEAKNGAIELPLPPPSSSIQKSW